LEFNFLFSKQKPQLKFQKQFCFYLVAQISFGPISLASPTRLHFSFSFPETGPNSFSLAVCFNRTSPPATWPMWPTPAQPSPAHPTSPEVFLIFYDGLAACFGPLTFLLQPNQIKPVSSSPPADALSRRAPHAALLHRTELN
jgi:hypothetical protein